MSLSKTSSLPGVRFKYRLVVAQGLDKQHKEENMEDLDKLIAITYKLSDTLSQMAANEIKFGADLCHLIEQISYDVYKTANELREINTYLVGGVA